MSASESPLTDEHAAYLTGFGVDIDVALAAGVRSEGRGIVFSWTGPDGRTVEQFGLTTTLAATAPEVPLDRWRGARAVGPPVNAPPASHGCPVDIVEGTKQYLAAVSYAPTDRLVVGVTGCQGTRKEGAMAIADMSLVSWHDRDVTIVFDADRLKNRDVYDAAEHLAADVKLRGREHGADTSTCRGRDHRARRGARRVRPGSVRASHQRSERQAWARLLRRRPARWRARRGCLLGRVGSSARTGICSFVFSPIRRSTSMTLPSILRARCAPTATACTCPSATRLERSPSSCSRTRSVSRTSWLSARCCCTC